MPALSANLHSSHLRPLPNCSISQILCPRVTVTTNLSKMYLGLTQWRNIGPPFRSLAPERNDSLSTRVCNMFKTQERNRLQRALDDMSFSCGAALQDAEIPTEVADIVYVKKMHCHEPIERLYYAAGFNDICVHCGAEVSPWSNKELYYPQAKTVLRSPDIPNAKKC